MELQHFSTETEMTEIKHPFHPRHPLSLLHPRDPLSLPQAALLEDWIRTCHACGRSAEGFCFRCSHCKFTLDDECYGLTPTKTLDGHEHRIPHLHHNHSLILCDVLIDSNFSRSCYACSLPIEDEISVYVCLECKYLLHKSCGELQPAENSLHPFHQHPLRLLAQKGTFCSVCGYYIEGYLFSCSISDCEFVLDLICASLTPTKKNIHEHGQSIQHLGHPHPLIMCDTTIYKFSRSCNVCLLPFDKGSVIYVCLECRIFLHRSCTGLPPKIKHPFHPQHPLTLLFQQRHPTMCKACQGIYSDYRCCTYECLSDSDIYGMHAKCASLVPTIWSELHEHPLAFFNKSEHDRIFCSACSRKITNATSFFRCVACDFNLHLHCNPTLPNTVKHECHLHRLAFTSSPIKVHPDQVEDAEFICDICEEKRNLFDSTYFCDKCRFVAHFECVLHEVVSLQEEERTLAGKNPVDTKMYTSIEFIEETSDEVASNDSDMEGTKQEISSSISSERIRASSARPEMKSQEMIREEIDARLKNIKALETKMKALELKKYCALQNSGDKLDQSTEGSSMVEEKS